MEAVPLGWPPGDRENRGGWRVDSEQQVENIQPSAGCQPNGLALYLELIRKWEVWSGALAYLYPLFGFASYFHSADK